MVAVAPSKGRISHTFFPGESHFFSDEPSDRERCEIGLNWYAYCSNNPINMVDPTGLSEEDYTVDYSKYEDMDLSISYFQEGDSTENPMTVLFNDQTYTLGEDLTYGDSVSFDAEFNLGDGGYLELATGGDESLKLNGLSGNMADSFDQYNAIVSTKAFKEALQYEKLQGIGEIALGTVFVGGALYATYQMPASNAAPSAMAPYGWMMAGAGLIANGISRTQGAYKQSVYQDVKDTLTPPPLHLVK